MSNKVVITCGANDPKTSVPLVDADILAFEQYFSSLGNTALSNPERAIIKTYLYYKLFIQK